MFILKYYHHPWAGGPGSGKGSQCEILAYKRKHSESQSANATRKRNAKLLKYKETLLRYESLARGYSTWRRAQVRAPGGGAALPGAREGEQAAGAAEASPSLI